MTGSKTAVWLVRSIVLLALIAMPASAQDPNACDEAGEAPDVIVGDLQGVGNYGNVGDIYGYSVGTTSCNIGTCWLNWYSGNSDHPVIGQNMYRVKDGRIEQIGLGWLKHGFFALSQTVCSPDCIGTDGTHLGVNCSDPYTAGLNGQQSNLGPRWEVNPSTGEFPYPFSTIGLTGDSTYKRIQVHRDDLDPALNAGAQYFVEGQYVTRDDAAAGNNTNNNSWRSINVNPTTLDISLTGSTVREQAGIQAWRSVFGNVKETYVDVPNDGRFIFAGKTTLNGDGTRRFDYAIQNVTSDRGIRSFEIPVPLGATVSNIGFHDVNYHSGEPWDGTDWDMYYDFQNGRVVWETQDTYADNPNANALRWGTLYTFWFDIDVTAWTFTAAEAELFKPVVDVSDPTVLVPLVQTPNPCNADGVCDPNETCLNCSTDCSTMGAPTGFCGDNICEPGIGENCTNCADCAGVQSGSPGGRYCCGDGGGDTPIGCGDARCNTGGLTCGTTEPSFCCGDGSCDPTEDSCLCAADCGAPPTRESSCVDGFDNDCDGLADCGDLDCCLDGACFTGVDADLDGFADCDCDDSNPNVWSTPAEVNSLTVDYSPIVGTTLSWDPPFDFGGMTVGYEALRSGNPDEFVLTSICISDPNPFDLEVVDVEGLAPGNVVHYLVRATNDCPGATGLGSVGTTSDDTLRSAAGCP